MPSVLRQPRRREPPGRPRGHHRFHPGARGTVWAWARALFGAGAALLALWLFVFNPNLLAHGKQVTSDVQAALFTTTAVYLLWRLLRRWSGLTFVATAAATAAALLAR